MIDPTVGQPKDLSIPAGSGGPPVPDTVVVKDDEDGNNFVNQDYPRSTGVKED